VRWAQFDALGAFTFYPEPGTSAARFPDQVSDETKQARLEELMLVQQEIAFAKGRRRMGSQITCLIDSVDDTVARGRFYGQAPDIDSVCIIESPEAARHHASKPPRRRLPKPAPGMFIEGKVTGTRGYDLLVEQI